MAWQGTLTAGAVQAIHNRQDISAPVLQALQVKQIQQPDGPTSTARWRITLSDGAFSTASVLLTTQLAPLAETGQIVPNTIVKLKRWIANEVKGRLFVICTELEVLQRDAQQIGHPQPFPLPTGTGTPAPPPPPTGSVYDQRVPSVLPAKLPVHPAPTASLGGAAPAVVGAYGGAPQVTPPHSTLTGSGAPAVFPIASLNPYQNRWTIRARVTRKGPVRAWTNQRGDGRLFSVDLADESGEIKATGFNEAVDRLFDLLEVDKVFYISKGSLRQKNPRFNNLKHEYELHFETSTVVEPCTDTGAERSIPKVRYDFVPIAKIEDVPKDAIVDVIGVVRESGPVSQVTSKDGRSFSKREVTLIDQSSRAVTLTLWNEQAERWDEGRNPVLAAKGVKVSDFGGRSLSAMQSSMIALDPDIPDSHRLRGWYDAMGKGLVVASISGGGRGQDVGGNDPWKDLGEIRAEQLGHDKADFVATKATIVHIRKENFLYRACPSETCNKKINDNGPNTYYCEKCQREYNTYKYRVMLRISVCDASGQQWFTAFHETAEAILGATAQDMGAWQESGNEAAIDTAFAEATFKTYKMKVRIKAETYQDELRTKCSIVSLAPVDFKQECERLTHAIEALRA